MNKEKVILHNTSEGNPFHEPISSTFTQIKNATWSLPYIHNVVLLLVNVFVFFVLSLLYLTIGIACQIVFIFAQQIELEKERMEEASSVAKSAHAMAIGIYFIFITPFWLLQLPFIAIAWGAGILMNVWNEVKVNFENPKE